MMGKTGVSNWYLERSDIKSCHIILAATLVLVIDDVLPHVILGSRILDLSLPSSVVHNKYQN